MVYALHCTQHVERFLYYVTVRVSNKIFPSTNMEVVTLTVKGQTAPTWQPKAELLHTNVCCHLLGKLELVLLCLCYTS